LGSCRKPEFPLSTVGLNCSFLNSYPLATPFQFLPFPSRQACIHSLWWGSRCNLHNLAKVKAKQPSRTRKTAPICDFFSQARVLYSLDRKNAKKGVSQCLVATLQKVTKAIAKPSGVSLHVWKLGKEQLAKHFRSRSVPACVKTCLVRCT
jgi:hypothetical protein